MKWSFKVFVAVLTCVSVLSSCKNEGCTDEQATNFNSSARFDDRSCVYVSGCTDCLAANYDSSAVSFDGSCEYLILDHLASYSMEDSTFDTNTNLYRDTIFNLTLERDTCGAQRIVIINYANISQSDGSKLEVRANLYGDTFYFKEQLILGPEVDLQTNDYILVFEGMGYIKNDSIFVPLDYTDKFDNPYTGLMKGKVK